ncbi:MAG TPA: hypothetical protein VGA84_10665 [Thermoanaerobaculia bacterium]
MKREEVELTPEELAEVNSGIEEAERGEGMDGFEFLRQLREGTWPSVKPGSIGPRYH